ncbi:50S ribosomal protein L25 [Candidatus Saccharibacteria bacterium]|nr:50S ribosomal protein L25 [Candidatus Saccharibacteria bacterium]
MGNKITLAVEKREIYGKKVAKLRKEALVPGVMYGASIEPTNIQAPLNMVEKVVKEAGLHSPVHITLGKKKNIAMIKDVDVDPVKGSVRHVAFHAVKQNEAVIAEVPIKLVGEGESAAEKAGLVVLQALEHVEIKALPMDLPESLEADITGLVSPGDRVLVGDITIPKGVELVDNDDGREGTDDDEQSIKDLVVANVYEPGALAAANEAAGGDAEDESEVDSENGSDTPQDTQDSENRPGGKGQDEPKQSNVDAK